MSDDLQVRRRTLRDASRWLHGHGPSEPGPLMREVAAWCDAQSARFDVYGTGDLIEQFEARVAELLGFPAARFFPSGTMAQQIALRIWSDRAGNDRVGMHPTSHVELHEQRGYAHLHRLHATLVGPIASPLVAEHFAAVAEPLAALLIELPIREAGGQLPTWDQLTELKQAVGDGPTRLHLDGARLWECAAWFGRSYAEICDGFDSVYVSFYKGIGALPGAMLLGARDFIDQAIVWQRRCGGNLYTLAPNVASAAMLLDRRLARMPDYYRRAREIAGVVNGIDGLTVLPAPPHTNMMHVFVARDAEAAMLARDRVAEEHRLWLFGGARPADLPGHCRFELYVGDAALALDDDTIGAGFRALMA